MISILQKRCTDFIKGDKNKNEKKVIYIVSSWPEWIDVAKKLKENSGWEPV